MQAARDSWGSAGQRHQHQLAQMVSDMECEHKEDIEKRSMDHEAHRMSGWSREKQRHNEHSSVRHEQKVNQIVVTKMCIDFLLFRILVRSVINSIV